MCLKKYRIRIRCQYYSEVIFFCVSYEILYENCNVFITTVMYSLQL